MVEPARIPKAENDKGGEAASLCKLPAGLVSR